MNARDKMRECKACDGTGCVYAPEHDLCVTYDHAYRCEPCLGSGQVSERIPAADALADAETLRLIARDSLPHLWDGRSGKLTARRVVSAGWSGEHATWNLGSEFLALAYAMEAAEYAFRAVPGLRA
jgi:hypothetical protein